MFLVNIFDVHKLNEGNIVKIVTELKVDRFNFIDSILKIYS
jgi:hypothetical protein